MEGLRLSVVVAGYRVSKIHRLSRAEDCVDATQEVLLTRVCIMYGETLYVLYNNIYCTV